MKYKAIIFDIDGTAVVNKLEAMPSARLVQVVRQAKGRIHLAAASGRVLQYGLPILQALDLSDPCIIDGGATVISPKDGSILRQTEFTQDQLDQISEVCQAYHYIVRAGHDAFGSDVPASGYRLSAPANIVFVEDVEATGVTPVIQALSKIPGILASSAKSYQTGYAINITPADGTKEHGIHHVLDMLRVSKEETIGVGDGDNDIHLFAAVGHRIAMGNASEQLKSIADEIAPTVEEDGLAWVIEKYAA